MRSRLRGQDGANAVEFALVLPILLMIVFGILWGGMAYNRQLTLTQSAREGARFGATLPFTGTAPDAVWFTDVRNRVVDVSSGHLTADGSVGSICIRYVPESGSATVSSVGTGSCAASDFPSSAAGARVQVLVRRAARFDVVFFSSEPVLSGLGVARYEVDG